MTKYIMALDSGTSSNRCVLLNHEGQICSLAQSEFTQIFPKPGYVEHDPNEIWSSLLGVATEAMSRIDARPEEIAAIGITNQRETTVVWDRHTGRPVYPAIVWQCRRTAPLCEALAAKGFTEIVREKTGLVLDAYFSASKIQWILDHVEGAREKAERGDLLFGTIDSWIIWKLTRGRVHATDYSNASRTMLFNIHGLVWDDELLTLFDIPRNMLPEVKPSSYLYGETDPQFFSRPIPITGVAGDQQAALFGHTCFARADVKNTYGTGCFLLMNTGKTPIMSKSGLVTTIAWGINESVYYALEGSVFVAGAAIQWLRDELRLIDRAEDSAYLASQVADTNGCYLVPAFTGLGAPYWDPRARGTIVGITRGVNKRHIVRATLESIAYQTYDILEAMKEDTGLAVNSLKTDGGAAMNDFLLQFQADILACSVIRPKLTEITAKGAGYLAGLAGGFWTSLEEIKEKYTIDRNFVPQMKADKRLHLLKGWHKAVEKAFAWADED